MLPPGHTLINLDNVLPNNTACPDVQMSNFGVTHQSLLQADGQTMCLELDKVVLVPDGIHVGGVSVVDGVTLLVGRDTPAIVYAVESAMPTVVSSHP